ncbi:aminotransferase class I/II-fold pyridoxal phosphate-dependent enzyme [Halococcus saccharolyticus]|uniref:8-amino-7-oxononanoate synthase n=1 Tax=Halococcus saccharolyticus DSM 5350 TaxID=1227455 RepID=M0MDL3_9EURY|nr:8-amino-7-oxononanoate synthase [Halococcus saccharolyticus]EMA42764.1 8-amino-7-oxononanoate synthase [Halococcus saccharolyticus DSM 5350]
MAERDTTVPETTETVEDDHQNSAHGFALRERLDAREQRGLRRDLAPTERVAARSRVATDPGDGISNFAGEDQVILASNNYLGLADNDRVQQAAAAAAREVGTGAGASRLVTGDTPVHRALERNLARTKDTERALVFSSGYAANVGTIAALAPDVIFSDELNHASIVDGCRLACAETMVYDHADADALGAAMARRDEQARKGEDESWLVVTDSVFSMDGDVAPLAAICDAAERHGAWVMVDEAHATGLYADGAGIVGHEGLGDRVQVQLGTLSKALASQGGYVAGSEALVEHLANAARSFVFSTGLAPPAAAAAREALAIAREGERRERLWNVVERLRDGLDEMGYRVLGESQILPVLVGNRSKAVAFGESLAEHGIVAPAIRPPTVPEGTSRIRVAPMATHTEREIERCLEAFHEAGRAAGVLDE